MSQGALRWLWVALLAGCTGDGGVLLVLDLRTDFALGAEMAAVEVLTLAGPTTITARVDTPQGDGLAGVRILEAEGVPRGDYHLRVVARRPDDTVLAETEAILSVRDAAAHTLLLTRDCADVECPAEDPALAACVAGSCETPACAGGDADACAVAPECASDADCEGDLACGTLSCVEGACVVNAQDACGPEAFCDPVRGCRPTALATCDRAPWRDAALCLDFEDDGGPDNTSMTGEATLVRSEAGAFSGTQGVLGVTESSGGTSVWTFTLPETYSDGMLYLTARLRLATGTLDVLDAIAADGGNAYLGLLDLRGPSTDPNDRLSIELQASGRYQHYKGHFEDGPGGVSRVSPPGAVVEATWVCAELEVDLDPSMGASELLVDGESMGSFTDVPTMGEGFGRLQLKLTHIPSPADHGVEVHLDDVVVSRTRVGCP